MLCMAFGDETLNETRVFEWHSCFQASLYSFEDEKRSGRLKISKTDEDAEKMENSL